MTVRELVELLALVNQDMQVVLFDSGTSESYQPAGAVTVEAGQVLLLSD